MFSWQFESKMTKLYVENDIKELENLRKMYNFFDLSFDDEVEVEKEVLKELKNKHSAVELAHLYNILVGLHTKHCTLIKSLNIYCIDLKQRQMMQNAPKVKKK